MNNHRMPLSYWVVTIFEHVRCTLFGHRPFDRPQFSTRWCTRCSTRLAR